MSPRSSSRKKTEPASAVQSRRQPRKEVASQKLPIDSPERESVEHQRAEDTLSEGEATLLTLVNANPESVFLIDFEGRILVANEAGAARLGKPIDDLVGSNVYDFFPPEVVAHRKQRVREVIRTGKPVRFEDSRWGQYIDNYIHPIRDAEGKITRLAILGIDITERKQAEDALRASEELYHRLFENMLNGFAYCKMLFDQDRPQDFIYLDVNTAFESLTGLKNVIGKRVSEVIPGIRESDPGLFEIYGRVALTGRPEKFETYLEALKMWFLISVYSPQKEYFVAVFDVINERKKAEEEIRRQLNQLAALHTIDQAIAGSADVKLILQAILDQAISQLGMDAADILLFNPNAQTLEFGNGIGFRTEALQHTRLPLGEGYAGRAALERQTVYIHDLRTRNTDFLRSPTLSQEGFVSYFGVPLIAKGKIKGVLEIFHRSAFEAEPEWLNFLNTLAGQAAIAIDNATLFQDLQLSNIELSMAYDATIKGWSHAMDLRDKETEGHTQRVTEITARLARTMGIDDAELIHIRRGALLHDMGKMGVPDSILLKADKLTEDEWVLMHQHPQFAFDMLSTIDYLKPALDIPYCHHEKWDGTGYPRGLKGEHVPLAARIFAVPDVYDALTSDRPYRKRWSDEEALEYIREQSGKHFDPKVVDAFLKEFGDK